MTESPIREAAAHFGKGHAIITPLNDGLIHQTYKVEYSDDRPIVLQNINRSTFAYPENIIYNYLLLSRHLNGNGKTAIQPLVQADTGEWFWVDGAGRFWRATQFARNSIILPFPHTPVDAWTAAKCFGSFASDLASMDADQFKVIIPGFHDLSLRYNQFEAAVSRADMTRLLKATHLIAELRQRTGLVRFYNSIIDNADYKKRIMHHDCKMSNILLDANTRRVIGPIDLDTVMPGYYFSDIGDLIRSMAGTVDENSTQWEAIDIRKDFYEAIIEGYLEGMGNAFTPAERDHIHYAGLMLLYMQCLRFLTDFLNNDIYYITTYPEQNLNRALNQMLMLEKLEGILKSDFGWGSRI
jgi:Ser/Thr protein kinase RdoA (MazF antagonist)